MRVFIFSNLLLEFLGKSFNTDSHFESYATARTLILTRAAWASLPPKRFSRAGDSAYERGGDARRKFLIQFRGFGWGGGGVVKKERLEDFRSPEAGISVLNSYILILK